MSVPTNRMPGQPQGNPKMQTGLDLLKQFLTNILRWGIAQGRSNGSPMFVHANTDGNEHCVDPNATYIVRALNFKNRSGNSGTLLVGSAGNESIQLTAGQWVSPDWTSPAQWFYKVTGSASTDVYEIWWSG